MAITALEHRFRLWYFTNSLADQKTCRPTVYLVAKHYYKSQFEQNIRQLVAILNISEKQKSNQLHLYTPGWIDK